MEVTGLRNRLFMAAEELAGIVFSLIKLIIQKTGAFAILAWEWFLSASVIEKLIILTGVPAIAAVILPAARFDIFESVYEVNNPLAPYMIFIGFIMFGTVFVSSWRFTSLIRIGVNLYFLGWALYCYIVPGQITKADAYTITPYYMLNFIVPIIYIVLSGISHFGRR
jgi:hypothetical protein